MRSAHHTSAGNRGQENRGKEKGANVYRPRRIIIEMRGLTGKNTLHLAFALILNANESFSAFFPVTRTFFVDGA